MICWVQGAAAASLDAVQEAAKRVPGLSWDQVFAGVKTPALGGDLTSVKCKGEWLPPEART